jgi:hypothetical protein
LQQPRLPVAEAMLAVITIATASYDVIFKPSVFPLMSAFYGRYLVTV